MKSIELLAPAGSPEALDAAVGEGADAVYLGLKDFNARLRSANFTYAQFESALRTLRRMGKRIYVTVNTVFEQREADRMYQLLKYLASMGPDALIVQDFGVVAMVKSEFPSLRLHASTQMNIASARGANALSRHGISRVVLARELSLEELKSVKAETNLELEVFVHGALCISVSGICLFSGYLGGKSANRGMCTQACRRLYHQDDEKSAASGRRNASEKRGASGRSGYYFSPNDLQLLDRVPDLAAAGIKALKIEGRMKSASYVGTVVSAYRLVIDAAANGDEEEIKRGIELGTEILRNDFARAKTHYLFDMVNIKHGLVQIKKTDIDEEEEKKDIDYQNKIDWLNPDQDGGTGINLGTILKVKGTGEERRALVNPPNGITLSARDSVRVHFKNDSGRVSHKITFAEKSSLNSYWISMPDGSPEDQIYLIQTKEMRKRYAPICKDSGGGRSPGRDRAPVPKIILTGGRSKKDAPFPEGLYAAVSRPEDLYVLQSSRPQRVMLAFSQKNARQLLADTKSPLPFKPQEMILTLNPWFPQDISNDATADDIKNLIARGYHQYMVNNPGHFSLFRGFDNVKLIAGPWLYMFNSWSLSFVSSLGVDAFVSPLENNRQNLEKTICALAANNRKKGASIGRTAGRTAGKGAGKNTGNTGGNTSGVKESALHSRFFITIFARPALFSIREDLSKVLDFESFADNTDETFNLVTEPREANPVSTLVYPEKHFSIIDKIPFLKEAGFGRFIIDLTGHSLKKSNYRDLIRAISESTPLPDSSRFNWKNGFYSAPPV